MDTSSPEEKNFLIELYNMTTGKLDAQVSMFEVGAAIGLEKDAAGKIAEELIGTGLVEVKTLSGGIGITASGLESVQTAGGALPTTAEGLDLGNGDVLEDKGRKALGHLIQEIQAHLSQNTAGYDQLSDMVIDLKTIDVQLLSSKPKTAIIREVLRSLHVTLTATGNTDLSETIAKVI